MMTNRFIIVSLVAAAAGCMDEAETPHAMEMPDPVTSPRVLEGLQVLYRFDEGKGLDVKDSSGVTPVHDLELDNLVTQKWVDGGGVDIVGTSVITSLEVAEKVFANCVQANAVSLEVWIEPLDNTQQGTIFSYSKNGQRNVTLAVNGGRYTGLVRTSYEDPMMAGEIITNNETIQTPDMLTQPTMQHVIFTRDSTGLALYLNGGDTKPSSSQPTTTPTTPPPVTDQTEWSPTYQLALGNEATGGSPWMGKIYMAAIYCKKLSLIEVNKNYTAGLDF